MSKEKEILSYKDKSKMVMSSLVYSPYFLVGGNFELASLSESSYTKWNSGWILRVGAEDRNPRGFLKLCCGRTNSVNRSDFLVGVPTEKANGGDRNQVTNALNERRQHS